MKIRTPLLVSIAVLSALSGGTAMAQTPTKCLEIESILVDACNPRPCSEDEGPSEMIRFRTGPSAIALNEISVTWPNNTWRRLVQNSTTASITSQLDASITGCGKLLEPPGGVIPPSSPVIMVTSTEMCVEGNSFAALADTIYIVYQNAGNRMGHFLNGLSGDTTSTPPSGNTARTMVMTYTPTNCRDTATYVRELLVNIHGNYRGSAADRNGSTVQFSWPGIPVATYVNYGCQAPFQPLFVEAEAVGTLCGGAGTVNISAEVIGGAFTSVLWSGGTGTFEDPTSLNTTYTAGAGDNGSVVLTMCAQTRCADPVCGTVEVPSGSGPVMAIAASGPLVLCPGDDVVLTASGADSYRWSGGQSTAAITVAAAGTYTVTGTNVCGTGEASVEVTQGSAVSVTITGNTALCASEATTLTATGATTYTWSTGATGATITVDSPGTISVTGTTACGTGEASITITEGVAPSVEVSGDDRLCPGEQVVLTATGNAPITWNTGATGNTLTVSQAGLYSATATNGCGAATDGLQVNASPLTAAFTASPTSGAAPLSVQFTNTSTQGASSAWDFAGSGTSSAVSPGFTFVEPGTYTVTLLATLDGCEATATASITITSPVPSTPSVIIVPNVFSPNNDRVNDVFAIDAANIVSLEVLIYNRWGEKVNQIMRLGEVWDGRSVSGNHVSEGTYFYTLRAQGADGREYDLNGHITLVR